MTPDLIVKLGDFAFSEEELPESISLGGGQMVAVHKMIGGARVIDSMGPDPSALTWSGWSVGEQAMDRMMYLDSLRAKGGELQLTFSKLVYRVLIASFRYVMQRQYQFTYSITLEVIEDMNLGTKALAAKPSPKEYTLADFNTANTLVTAVGTPAMKTRFAALKSALAAINDFAKATQAQINAVLAPVKDLRSMTQDLIASANNTIGNVTTLGGILPNNPVAQQANVLLNQVNTMNSQPQLVQLDDVLGRLQTNVTNSNSGTRTITVGTGSLFDLATQEYGDPTAWTTIARANGLSDPQITSPTTLIIPAKADGSGGVFGG